jgi:hypothetical protein
VMCKSYLCAKNMSAWEGFSRYELATRIKVLRERKPLLISEFIVEVGC